MNSRAKLFPIWCLIILTLTFTADVAAQKERQVTPVDEAKKDAFFLAFREKFIAAVKKRDVKFLLDALDRDVQGSFGGDSGIADFKRLWKLDQPNSKLWNELLTVLTNGGTFVKDSKIKNKQFCAPYSFTVFPPDLDVFEYEMIFGNNVNLRAKPDLKSAVVAQLSYNIVKVDYETSVKKPKTENDYSWLKIETLGGKRGFVNADFVRSPIDYRGCFEKINGKWKMTVFLAGD
ncbi:MAG: SH3 domain-containing protein [Pyrinomonadaceae bacterium]|nr:SH3 domain-containing protein [Pyrinomonadaceae bacterium]